MNSDERLRSLIPDLEMPDYLLPSTDVNYLTITLIVVSLIITSVFIYRILPIIKLSRELMKKLDSEKYRDAVYQFTSSLVYKKNLERGAVNKETVNYLESIKYAKHSVIDKSKLSNIFFRVFIKNIFIK